MRVFLLARFLRSSSPSGVVALFLLLLIVSPSAISGPLSCQALYMSFQNIANSEPHRFINQTSYLFKMAHLFSPGAGSELCGPTCIFNMEQIARKNIGLPYLEDAVAYVKKQQKYLQDLYGVDLTQGLDHADAAELQKLSVGELNPDKSFYVRVKSTNPLHPRTAQVTAQQGSIELTDLPTDREPGQTMLLIKWRSGGNGHYVNALYYDPAAERLLLQDPLNATNIWWTDLLPSNLNGYNTFTINVNGDQADIESILSIQDHP